MKVTLTHYGKSVELDLTAEQMKALGLEEEKKTGYERGEEGSTYYHALGDGRVISDTGMSMNLSNLYYETANYYTDHNLAVANAHADRLMRNLRRFAAENGGIPSVKDWGGSNNRKWFIEYTYLVDRLSIAYHSSGRISGVVYFKDLEGAKKAIELFHDELIWYFTEYEAMLR